MSYALCHDHHPQYCRYIEELNDNSNDKAIYDGCKNLFAKLNKAGNNIQQTYDEKKAESNPNRYFMTLHRKWMKRRERRNRMERRKQQKKQMMLMMLLQIQHTNRGQTC